MTDVVRLFLYLAPAPDDVGQAEGARSPRARGGERSGATVRAPMHGPTDAELIVALRADDASAFTVLMTRHASALARYAGRLVGNQGVADELVQDAFFGVWQRRHELDVRGSPRAFFYGVVRNVCLNWRRRERLELTHLAASAAEIDARPRPTDDPLGARDLERDVAAIVATLPPRAREVITLRLRDDLTYPEIAAVLGVAQKTVESHVTAALRTLRQELRRLGWGAE